MVRKSPVAGLAFIAATLAVAAFAPATAVAHPCATAAQTFLTLNGGAAWSGLPALDEETDCAIIDQSGLTVADTTVAAASAVPDAVSSYVWSPNMTPLGPSGWP